MVFLRHWLAAAFLVVPVLGVGAQLTPGLKSIEAGAVAKGKAALEQKNYVLAIANLTQALLIDPSDGEARYLRGEAFYNNGMFERARREYSFTLLSSYKVPALPLKIADLDRAAARTDDALEGYEAYFKLNPSALQDVEFRMNRARARRQNVDKEECVEDMDFVVQKRPTDATAFMYRALCQDDEEKAAKDFQTAIKLNPKLKDNWNYRLSKEEYVACPTEKGGTNALISKAQASGDAYALFKAAKKAIECPETDELFATGALFDVLVKQPDKDLDDDVAGAYSDLVVEKNGITPSRIAQYSARLKATPGPVDSEVTPYSNPGIMLEMDPSEHGRAPGYYDFHLNKDITPKTAQSVALMASYTLLLEPNNETALGYRARAYANMDSMYSDLAVRDANAVLAIDPNNSLAYNARGVARDRQHRYEEAIADFTKVLALNPDPKMYYMPNRALNNRVNTYISLRRYGEALSDLNRILSTDSSNVRWFYLRGFVNSRLNNVQPAISDLQKTLEVEPANYAAMLYLVGLYDKAGQPEKGDVLHLKLLTVYPDTPEVKALAARNRPCCMKAP